MGHLYSLNLFKTKVIIYIVTRKLALLVRTSRNHLITHCILILLFPHKIGVINLTFIKKHL